MLKEAGVRGANDMPSLEVSGLRPVVRLFPEGNGNLPNGKGGVIKGVLE